MGIELRQGSRGVVVSHTVINSTSSANKERAKRNRRGARCGGQSTTLKLTLECNQRSSGEQGGRVQGEGGRPVRKPLRHVRPSPHTTGDTPHSSDAHQASKRDTK